MSRREFNRRLGMLKARLTTFGHACHASADSDERWLEQALLEKEMEALFEQVAKEGIEDAVPEGARP